MYCDGVVSAVSGDEVTINLGNLEIRVNRGCLRLQAYALLGVLVVSPIVHRSVSQSGDPIEGISGNEENSAKPQPLNNTCTLPPTERAKPASEDSICIPDVEVPEGPLDRGVLRAMIWGIVREALADLAPRARTEVEDDMQTCLSIVQRGPSPRDLPSPASLRREEAFRQHGAQSPGFLQTRFTCSGSRPSQCRSRAAVFRAVRRGH